VFEREFADLRGDRLDQFRLFERRVAEGFVAERPTQVLENMRGQFINPHIFGQVFLEPFERAEIKAARVRPRIALEILPGLDWPLVLIHPLAPAAPLAFDRRRVRRLIPVEFKIEAGEFHAKHVVAKEPVRGDQAAQGGMRVRPIYFFVESEAGDHRVEDFRIGVEFAVIHAAGRRLAADHLARERFKIRLNGNFQQSHRAQTFLLW